MLSASVTMLKTTGPAQQPSGIARLQPVRCRSDLRSRSGNKHGHCTIVAAKHLYALDFDGVVCDSVGESSVSGWKAAARVWPELFSSPQAVAEQPRVLQGMREVRPVVETGYENIVQTRLLLDGITPQQMLATWPTMLPKAMADLQLQRAELVDLFGRVRDEWIEQDLSGWLELNSMYQRVPEALRTAQQVGELYIVTTKQAHFTDTLLRNMAGVEVPMERIYSQTVSGQPKAEVLVELQQRHADAAGMHFVEDKMGTLDKVAADPRLTAWQLYLVDWGYNTQEERARAEASDRIQLINKQQFVGLLSLEA